MASTHLRRAERVLVEDAIYIVRVAGDDAQVLAILGVEYMGIRNVPLRAASVGVQQYEAGQLITGELEGCCQIVKTIAENGLYLT